MDGTAVSRWSLFLVLDPLHSHHNIAHKTTQGIVARRRKLVNMSDFYSECGDDFDEYVRRVVPPMNGTERAVTNLWIMRQCRLHLDGDWKEGKVVEWYQRKADPSLHLTEWSVTVQLDKRQDKEVGTRDLLTLRVNRMNIKGGGTLQREAVNSELISLEWLDEAFPSVNLEEGMLVYKCPYCRAVEPIMEAHEQAVATKSSECPVCLEIQNCRVLGCGHCICQTCWNSCLKAASTIHLQFSSLDSQEVQREKRQREQEYSSKLASGEARRVNCFAQLVKRTVSSGHQDLQQFRKELMVESMRIFFYSDVKAVISQLSADAIKIILQVLEDRKDELFAMSLSSDMEMRAFVSSLFFYCCDVIAEKYRQAGRIRFALPWSELALFHAKQTCSRPLLAAAHIFLGSSQQSAGMLSEACKTFDGSLGLGSSAVDVWKYREALICEIEQWTGSSGRLTPGC